MASRLVFWVGAIQRQGQIPASRTQRVRLTGGAEIKTYDLVLPAVEAALTWDMLTWVVRVANGILAGTLEDPLACTAARDEALARLGPMINPSINIFNLRMAADQLQVPVLHLTNRVLVLGTGVRSRWMDSSITDQTPWMSVQLCRNKFETARILQACGLPGAVNRLVASEEDAVTAAASLGYPVVLKPADLDRGVGVVAGVRSKDGVCRAYAQARAASPNVLVEQWVPGHTHRLTVLRGEVIRITRRIAGGVIGDGVLGITALMAKAQQEGRQQRTFQRYGHYSLSLDAEALELLAEAGRDPDWIPAEGEYVRLRRRDNVSAGGWNETLTLGDVHPSILQLAVDAATVLRLDFAGVDFITEDVTKPWHQGGGVICEINAQPQMGARREPQLYHRVLKTLLGETCRVPAHLILCPAAAPWHQSALQQALALPHAQGVSDYSGLWVDGQPVAQPFPSGFEAALALALRPDVRAMVCVMTVQEVVQLGLPLPLWDRIEALFEDHFSDQERTWVPMIKEMLHGHVATTLGYANA